MTRTEDNLRTLGLASWRHLAITLEVDEQMQPDELVDAIYAAVYRAAIDGVIRLLLQPPGRSPHRDIADLSTWYTKLSEVDQDAVHRVVRLAVDQAVFGMLAALDGARSLGATTQLSLRDGDHEMTADHDLHELFRSRVDQEL